MILRILFILLLSATFNLVKSQTVEEVDSVTDLAGQLLYTNPDSAYKLAEIIIEKATKIEDNFSIGYGYHLIGFIYGDVKNQSIDAFYNYLKALDFYKKVNTNASVDNQLRITSNIAVVLFRYKFYHQAYHYYSEAINLSLDKGYPKRAVAPLIGKADALSKLLDYEKYDSAIHCLDSAKTIAIETGYNDYYRLILSHMGLFEMEAGNLVSAKEHLIDAIEYEGLKNYFDSCYLSHSYGFMGMLFQKTGNLDSALYYLNRSIQISDKLRFGLFNDPLSIYLQIAKTHFQRDSFHLAIKNAQIALGCKNYTEKEEYMELINILRQAYQHLGNQDSVLHYSIEYAEQSHQLFELELQEDRQKIEKILIEFQQKEKQENLAAVSGNYNRMIVTLSSIIVLLLIAYQGRRIYLKKRIKSLLRDH